MTQAIEAHGLKKRYGKTMALDGLDLSTQYLDEADHLANQVVIIDHGRAVAAGTSTELKRRIGGNVVEIHVRDSRDLAGVAVMLERLDRGTADIDEATRRVSMRVDCGGDGLMSALRSLHSSGVQIEDIAMRQPNLDEVFLSLTGMTAGHEDDDTGAAAEAA